MDIHIFQQVLFIDFNKKIMNGFIKKLLIIAIAAIAMNLAVEAQVKGDKAVGASLVLTSPPGEFDLLGLGAKFRYNTSKLFRFEGTFNYLFKKDFVSMWDVYIDAHILISLADRIKLYPLAGLGILGYHENYPVITDDSGFTYGGKQSSTRLGYNLGGGMDYKITDKLIFNIEYNYKWEAAWNDAWGGSYLSAGIVYLF